MRQVLFGDDAINRAIGLTNAAIDALVGIDDINGSFGDAVDRTVGFAGTASDTSIQNFSWHRQPSLRANDLFTS